MKILVTGCNGQVGWELGRALAPLAQVTSLDRSELDLAKPDAIRTTVRALHPDIIVNAAAYTAVDKAENEPELAQAINAQGPQVLAEEAKRCNALLIHYSTDYVFDGRKTAPYVEDDTTNPLCAYGRSKLDGEQAIQSTGCRHVILRTAWVYAARGKNFMLTIMRLARERPELRVVNDQFGAPTSAPAIADATASIVGAFSRGTGTHGIFHLTAAGRASWFDFAELIVKASGPPYPVVHPIPASEYPTPAQRPGNSCLDNAKLAHVFGITLADWRIEAQRILAELRQAAPPPGQKA